MRHTYKYINQISAANKIRYQDLRDIYIYIYQAIGWKEINAAILTSQFRSDPIHPIILRYFPSNLSRVYVRAPLAPARREQLIVIEATKRIIFRTYFRRSGGHGWRLRAHIITRDRILRSSRDTLEIPARE